MNEKNGKIHHVRPAALAISAGLLAIVVAGWGTVGAHAGPRSAAAVKHGGTMTISWGPKGSWTRNFNPYSGTVSDGTLEMIYEPLFMFNQAKGGKVMPWLASGYKWGKGNKTLTFTIRKGVHWNDGKPFTSHDVKFSIGLAKKYPSIACGNCWAALSGISTPNAHKVVFHFKTVDTTMLYYLGSFDVVPQHKWAKVNPTTFTNPNPVATGPYKLGSFSSQVYTLVRNKRYWQAGKPYVSTLRFPAFSGNDSDQLAVVKGEVDWAGLFIPNAQSTYASKSKTNHFWFYGGGAPVSLWMNDSKSPFNNVHVRRAIAYAMDRATISKIAEYGYAPPGNAGFVQPQFRKQWGSKVALKMLPKSANVGRAKAELKKAKGVNLSKHFSLLVVSGWTDWNTSVQLIANDLKAIGITANVTPLQFGDYVSHLQSGNFDMAMSWMAAGPTPYYVYQSDFTKSGIPTSGQATGANFSRWHNSHLDSLLNQYSHTSNESKQVAIIKQAQGILAANMPIAPIFAGGDLWDEYSTKNFVGWPVPHHPYDLGSPYSHPSNLDVILHVHLK